MNNFKIVRSKRSSIAIHILPTGQIEVRAPKFLPEFAIKAFVKSRRDWIEKRQAYVLKNKTVPKKFINGERFLYLGHEYQLLLGPSPHIEIKDNTIHFPLALAKHGNITLEKWYIKQAKSIIKDLVEEYSKEMNFPYNGISFSDTRSKWGSCTPDNRLQFNWRLIMAPLLVIRYVVIHELVHTVEKNHKTLFWNKVRAKNPSYKNQIKWLKINGDALKI